VDIYPQPLVEIHPRLAGKYGIQAKDWVTVATRRGEITLQASVVKTIRPDTVFIPYHWPNERSANRLTHRTLDPRSKIPEFKVSACQLRKAAAPPEWAGRTEVEEAKGGTATTSRAPGMPDPLVNIGNPQNGGKP